MNASNNGYTIVSLVFFISYTIFQAPAVVFIRTIGPRNFLAGICLAWGAVMIVRSKTSPRIPRGALSNMLLNRDLASCPAGKSCASSESSWVFSRQAVSVFTSSDQFIV